MVIPKILCTSVSLIGLLININDAYAYDLSKINHEHGFTISPINTEPKTYQIARSVFLPDTKDDLGFSGHFEKSSYVHDEACQDYTLLSCPAHGTCASCATDSKKKKLISCASPHKVSGNNCVCPAETSIIYPNDKCTKYCDSKCIEKTCSKSSNQTNCTNGTKTCDDGCGGNDRQCCIECTNKITSKPENSSYTYSSCTDGNGTKQIQTGWACNSGYHKKDSACEKNCISTNCSGYTLSSCPANGNCSKCTKTSTSCYTDGTLYKLDSCKEGYKISGNSCVASGPCTYKAPNEAYICLGELCPTDNTYCSKPWATCTNIEMSDVVHEDNCKWIQDGYYVSDGSPKYVKSCYTEFKCSMHYSNGESVDCSSNDFMTSDGLGWTYIAYTFACAAMDGDPTN